MGLFGWIVAIFRYVFGRGGSDSGDSRPQIDSRRQHRDRNVHVSAAYLYSLLPDEKRETNSGSASRPSTTKSVASKPTATQSSATKHPVSSPPSSSAVKFPPPPPVTTNNSKPSPPTTSSSLSKVSREPKQSEVSTSSRDSLSSPSVIATKSTPTAIRSKFDDEDSTKTSDSFAPLYAYPLSSKRVIEPSSQNQSSTLKSSHQISSSQPIQESKSRVSITAKPPPSLSPSPKPAPSFPSSHVQNKPSMSIRPALRVDSSSSDKNNFIWVEKDASLTYAAPEDIKRLIEMESVPHALKEPLSISTYKDYFRALLYAEDYYLEKWDGFKMFDVTLELHDAAIYKRKSSHSSFSEDDKKDKKKFVAFEMDEIPERRPFLLSRDFVSLKPSGKNSPIFEGLVYRVVKSNLLLSELGNDFLSTHHPSRKYDVKFSFNRVCLKRAHQAIESASGPLLRNFIFPKYLPQSCELVPKHSSLIDEILRLQDSPPYLVEGHLSINTDWKRNGLYRDGKSSRLSKTGNLIVKAVVELLRASPLNRILLCAPTNTTCDELLRGLKWMRIPESDIFRANAAFREREDVPEDILRSCPYEEETECFICPSQDKLSRYKVILTTFMSAYRLHNEGLQAGHFSHVILVDASSVTEPEALVPLANFATEGTTVVVFGELGNRSGWIRSPMARKYGLPRSYFERLCKDNPNSITILSDDH
ncbi:unnamed protein product [Cuscuta epithymum]|uniref:Helicase MOV-10-like beta-barrel domain-containing protein n=1 Tax=Cuscuta epithymum TaxID=186058 RepID=A0AAV0DDN1_9ASTE|nr:unnamed protein product [Cuscuta epithymum]